MALYLSAKAPDAIYRYTWEVPVADGDSVSSASATVDSGTATVNDYEVVGNGVVLVLGGGAAGEVTVILAEAVTSDGETITETIYLPIRSSEQAFSTTAADVVAFALRKVAGIGENADADEASDALERLNDMIAMWRIDGIDLGLPLPLLSATVLYLDDAYVLGLKYNLIIALADLYDFQPSPFVVRMADESKDRIRTALFSIPDLTMPRTLSVPVGFIGELFP